MKNAQPKIIMITFFFGEMMPLVHMNALFKNRGKEWRKKKKTPREVTFNLKLDALWCIVTLML